MSDFKKGDIVKLRGWHTARGIWNAIADVPDDAILGISKRDWERFRLCEPLVLTYSDEQTPAVWRVKSGVIAYYIPEACMYKSRKKCDR